MLQSIKNLLYGAWDVSLTGFLPAATAALLCVSAHGQKEASFGFGEPKVIKLDWGYAGSAGGRSGWRWSDGYGGDQQRQRAD